MNTRTLWVSLLAVMLVSGCGLTPTGPEPIKIGLLVSETGQFSSYGQDNLAAALLFRDEINAAGGVAGRPLELVIYNTESSPARAVAGARKLIEQDRVVALVGLGLVSEASAVAPLVENGPVTYSTCAAYRPEHRMMFVGGCPVPTQHEAVANWLRDRGLVRFALVTTNDATGQLAEASLGRQAERCGLDLVAIEAINPADVDATAQLARVAQKKPDAVVAWAVGRPLGVILRGAQAVGLDVPLFTSSGNRSLELLASLSDCEPTDFFIPSPRDGIWPELAPGHPARDMNERFYNLYLERFGRIPGSGSTIAWDAMDLLCRAFAEVGTSSEDVVRYLEGIRGYQGLVGIYYFSPDDHCGLGVSDIVMARVREGKLYLAR